MVPLHISLDPETEEMMGKSTKIRKEISARERERYLGGGREAAEAQKETVMMGEGRTAGWEERKSKRQQRIIREME